MRLVRVKTEEELLYSYYSLMTVKGCQVPTHWNSSGLMNDLLGKIVVCEDYTDKNTNITTENPSWLLRRTDIAEELDIDKYPQYKI